MKLLTVFGLAVAVVALDKAASGDKNLLTCELEDLLKLFKANPRDPDCCSKVFFMVDEGKISLKDNPNVIFPLIRYCLEVDADFFHEYYPKMDVVHVAAFIFMFRAKGEEEAAEHFYNAAMKEHFFEKFKARHHEEPYILESLWSFEHLPQKDKEYHILQAVKMCSKESDSWDLRQNIWFKYAELAALVFVNMKIPLGLLIAGVILHQKKLPVWIAHDKLSNFQLMFFSLTRDKYLRLEEPERAQLLAFLERYLRFRWRNHKLPTEKLSGKEFEQFKKAFKFESLFECFFLTPDMIPKFANHFCNAMEVGCPAFLLKEIFDLYLGSTVFTGQILDKKYCFLMALIGALKMVEEDLHFGRVRGKEYPSKELVCSQIERTILECYKAIKELRKEFAKSPKIKEWWKMKSSAREYWITFKKKLKICARLKLSN